jgi:RTX calcium-binding nonapeptide repeat (4 copies)
LANTIYGRQGTDTISSLSGNDHIYVIDGEKDFVNCGSGLFGGEDQDYVAHDAFDAVSNNCEVKVLDTN